MSRCCPAFAPSRLASALVLLLTLAPATARAQAVPSPEEYFGFAMGTDRKLARWDEILSYLTVVADHSQRIRVDTIGPSTLGNPFVTVTMSSPANLARIDAIRDASHRLAEGRVSRQEAESLATDLPATVVINHNIHSSEIASSQTSVDLVYRLASADDPDTRQILDNVVTVLIPSTNPDGQIMVVDWYRRNVGTEFEKARMPWLYHHYAGHDDNRDYFQANLVETREWMQVMFHTAYPQVYLDQHQMGSNGPRIFVPPYPDPMNPDIHPLVWQETRFLGGSIVTALQAADKQGVVTDQGYRIWGQEGALTGRYHNMVALLTETASANVASPVTVTRQQLLASVRGGQRILDEYAFSMEFVDPWWGGEWHLGDIVEYQTIAATALLDQVARNRRRVVLGRWQMASETIARGVKDGPYAYVIPSDQRDPVTAAKLARTLALQGIQVQRADEPFTATSYAGIRSPGAPLRATDEPTDSTKSVPQPRTFPAGSWVVLVAQPARAAVLDLLQPVARPRLREYPDGPWLRSYDAAAYTMPLQMGVEADRIDESFSARLTPVTDPEPPQGRLPNAQRFYALPTSVNLSYAAANLLMARGVRVSRTPDDFWVSSDQPAARGLLDSLRMEGLPVQADLDDERLPVPVTRARVGLYQGWAASMDEGWTRLLLDRFAFDHAALSNDDVRSADLRSRFDVIIIPAEIPLRRLVDGTPAGEAPPEYVGGIGEVGVENLKRFVEDGGTLITLERGDEVVLKYFDLPVRDALEGVGTRDFFAPPSIFRLDLDPTSSLADGSPRTVAAKWSSGRAYEPTEWNGDGASVRVVGRWASDPDSVLMSGELVGAGKVAGKAAILDVSYGRGRIIMYGFRVQSRAQTAGTFRLLFNAMFRSDAREPTRPDGG